MRKRPLFLFTALLCMLLSACGAEGSVEEASTELSEMSISAEMSETASQTTAETAAETTSQTTAETTAETTSQTTAETTAETTSQTTAETAAEPAEAISKLKYVDFQFIELYKGTDISPEISDKAIELCKTTEEYLASQSLYSVYKDLYPEYFNADGVLVPKFREAYTEDFDGDGNTESFLLIDMPYSYSLEGEYSDIFSFLVFSGSEGFEVIDIYSEMYDTRLIDYGNVKQPVIGGSCSMGAADHTSVWGVKNGKAVEHLSFRGYLYKQGCFLTLYGWQTMGGTLLYDFDSQCYRLIEGVPCDISELRKMDTDKNISILYDENINDEDISASIIGEKYYHLTPFMRLGVLYTYSDGKFIREKTTYIRDQYAFSDEPFFEGEPLVDFNYDNIVSQMTPVAVNMPSYSIEDIDEQERERISSYYGEYSSCADTEIKAYLGIYNRHTAVAMSDGSSDAKTVTVGGETLTLPVGTNVYLYSEYSFEDNNFDTITEEQFIDIETAYSYGILKDHNIRQLKAVLENS